MPIISEWQSGIELDLRDTNMGFCSNPKAYGLRSPWTTVFTGFDVTCTLENTEACQCPELWPYCTTNGCRKSISFCPPSTRPSPSFICVGGVWTSNSSVSEPILVLPSTSTTVVVSGNLTSPTIVFQSPTATLIVTGCLNVSTIVLELTPEQLKGIKSGTVQTLIQTLGEADPRCRALSGVTIITKTPNEGCRKLSVKKQPSGTSPGDTSSPIPGLAVVFHLDASSCNIWWIVLVSVVGLLVVAGSVTAALVISHLKARKPITASESQS